MKKFLFLPAALIWLGGLLLIQLPSGQSSPLQETVYLRADMDTYIQSWSGLAWMIELNCAFSMVGPILNPP